MDGDIFEELEITKEDFNVPADALEKLWKQVRHAEVDANDLVHLCKLLFPNNVEAQLRAMMLHMVASEWGDDEEYDEDYDDEEEYDDETVVEE